MPEQYPGPKGLIPVTSGKAEDANIITRQYLDSILVEMRVLDAVEPDLRTTIFGHEFTSPIVMPAFSHLNHVGENGRKPMTENAWAAKKMGMMNWVGMEPNETFEEIAAVGVPTIRNIKPFADHDRILNEIAHSKAQGALAVGMDICHVPGEDGKYDVVDGIPLGPVTVADLKTYVQAAGETPFVAKGVLSVTDALKAREAGVKGIVISHHHGRLPFATPPLLLLPEIKAVLKGTDITIFVDGGIETGYDAYKALALGADAVSVGRAILWPLLKEATPGVMRQVAKMNQELSQMMMYTNVHDTKSFDASVLHLPR